MKLISTTLFCLTLFANASFVKAETVTFGIVPQQSAKRLAETSTKTIDASNEQQRHASAFIRCEDSFSSATPYAEELEQNVDLFFIHYRDIRCCRFPGEQNRSEDRYEEEAYDSGEEGQISFQSLSLD